MNLTMVLVLWKESWKNVSCVASGGFKSTIEWRCGLFTITTCLQNVKNIFQVPKSDFYFYPHNMGYLVYIYTKNKWIFQGVLKLNSEYNNHLTSSHTLKKALFHTVHHHSMSGRMFWKVWDLDFCAMDPSLLTKQLSKFFVRWLFNNYYTFITISSM